MTDYHDDKTITKVFDALHDAGIVANAGDVINALHNAGILFRERRDGRSIEARLTEYVSVNSTGLATVKALLNSGRIPPDTVEAVTLRGHVDFWERIAGDLAKILNGEELEFSVQEFVL